MSTACETCALRQVTSSDLIKFCVALVVLGVPLAIGWWNTKADRGSRRPRPNWWKMFVGLLCIASNLQDINRLLRGTASPGNDGQAEAELYSLAFSLAFLVLGGMLIVSELLFIRKPVPADPAVRTANPWKIFVCGALLAAAAGNLAETGLSEDRFEKDTTIILYLMMVAGAGWGVVAELVRLLGKRQVVVAPTANVPAELVNHTTTESDVS